MVTKQLSSRCGAHLVESYWKESNISDKNWRRYLFSSPDRVYDVITWLICILKTLISLERKEIFENSKQHVSFGAVYLFMFQNGLDRKDAIFVMVPL